ncbi:MAG: methyl-accepting chemotaxis protein [Lachnospiraceae bacterium]|nr:methyl-accepting chemotaxis protein [Lachnospiraceae bacterium]
MKKGIKITAKIVLMTLFPLIFISVVAVLMGASGEKKIAYQLMEENLHNVAYDVYSLYDMYAEGDYSYEDGIFKKGKTELTDDYSIMDSIKEQSDIEVTLFWGKERVLTTVTDEKGERAIGTTLDTDFASDILSGKDDSYFAQEVQIAGDDYCGYYIPLKQSDGEIVGMIFTGRAKKEVRATITAGEYKIAGSMAVILLITIIIVIFVIRAIVTALKHTINRLDDVAEGKLDFEMHEKMLQRADEIGEMSQSIQGLINEFKNIITDLTGSSQELQAFSEEFEKSFDTITENITNINTAVDEIANGATSQAGETVEANDEISRMGDAIGNAVDDIEQLNHNSDKMRDYSESAESTLQELVAISEQTSQAIDEVRTQTNLTNESAKAIQAATDMITSISAQTNMLSLNASIEAARAGENGKGFAVVADEIRNLSEQSKNSADEIMAIVSELIRNSNTSVATMDQVSTSVQEQNQKLENTKAMFASLNEEIESVSNGVDRIREIMETLEGQKDTVTTSVEQLASIAEENAASTEETSASMTELRDIVKQCHDQTIRLTEISRELNKHTNHFQL